MCVVKLLWIFLLFDNGYDGLKKLKEEERHYMTNCGLVALALKLYLTTSTDDCYIKTDELCSTLPLVKAVYNGN
jgi:hypothetical protein